MLPLGRKQSHFGIAEEQSPANYRDYKDLWVTAQVFLEQSDLQTIRGTAATLGLAVATPGSALNSPPVHDAANQATAPNPQAPTQSLCAPAGSGSATQADRASRQLSKA